MLYKKRPLTSDVKGLFDMALQPGLEPGTHGLTVHCSTDWAIGEEAVEFFVKPAKIIAAFKWCVF